MFLKKNYIDICHYLIFNGDRRRGFAYRDALTINAPVDFRDILRQEILFMYVHCLKVSFELFNECGQENNKKSEPLGGPPCML